MKATFFMHEELNGSFVHYVETTTFVAFLRYYDTLLKWKYTAFAGVAFDIVIHADVSECSNGLIHMSVQGSDS